MLRSVAGVLVGYLVFAVSAFSVFQISGRDPHQPQDLAFAAFSVACGIAFAFVGGYVAGAIAGRRSRVHGGAVAFVIVLGATASILAQSGEGSKWSQAAALTLMAPAAFAGGLVRSAKRPS